MVQRLLSIAAALALMGGCSETSSERSAPGGGAAGTSSGGSAGISEAGLGGFAGYPAGAAGQPSAGSGGAAGDGGVGSGGVAGGGVAGNGGAGASGPDAGYPGPLPARSFHIVHKDFPYHWDSILALLQKYPAVSIASQNRPDSVPADRWTQMLHTSAQPTGAALAANIDSILTDTTTAPSMVMVDELNGNTVAVVAELAQTMRNQFPQWQGRWGAFTTVFTGGQPAVDELLKAHAHIAVERYIEQSWYCAQGNNGGERDIALATFFDGNSTLARFHWLVQRKAVLQSQSPLTVVFGVTDRYMDGQSPAIYLDRMFYVWVTRTKHPGAIAVTNGGPGAWKWDPNHPPGGFGTSNTSRDQAFAESVEWYSVQGKVSSRLGPVPCP